MQIGVYGSGYLGTVISACLADFGTPVSCCHPDRTRMVEMAQGNIPFFEKNLKEIIRRNVRAGRLSYSTDIETFARRTGVIFLAEDNADNLSDIAMRIIRLAPKPPILTIVTPVSVGTANALEKTISDAGLQATIVSQPMFFTDGCAVEDFNWPDRLILGSASNEAVQVLKQIFHPLVMRGVPVIVTNQATAELVREAATAFVATKISFINEVATLCDRVNADAVHLGLTFKPNTNSVAGSSSVRLAETLISRGAHVRAYDPVAIPEAKTHLNGAVRYCDSAYAVAEGSDALIVGTGWPEFRALDFDRIKHLLKHPVIVDTKNCLDSTRLRALGFAYVGIGRG